MQRKNGRHQYLNVLATLLGEFYEYLSSQPQPSDDEVRKTFTHQDQRWKRYCKTHKLMNADHLFVLNVKEAWARHTIKQPQSIPQ
jgi:hypothetical protein